MAEEWDTANYVPEQQKRQEDVRENFLQLGLDRAQLSKTSLGNVPYNSGQKGASYNYAESRKKYLSRGYGNGISSFRGRGGMNNRQEGECESSRSKTTSESHESVVSCNTSGRGQGRQDNDSSAGYQNQEQNEQSDNNGRETHNNLRGRGADNYGNHSREDYNNRRGRARGLDHNNVREGSNNARGRGRGRGRGGGNFHNNGRETHSNSRGRGKGVNNSEPSRGNGEQSSSSAQGKKTQKPMCYTRLKELLSLEDADEVMFSLKAEGTGFPKLLQQQEIKPDIMAMVLELLAIASRSKQPRNLAYLMETVGQTTQFIYITLPSFITGISVSMKSYSDIHLNSLTYLLEFFLQFCDQHPATSLQLVPILLPNVKVTINKIFENGREVDLKVFELADALEDKHNMNIKKYEDKNLRKLADEEKQHSKEPPGSFRNIPIYPTTEDLIETPFLRANIVEGKYIDVEHYLDVQFRLLREDSVRSLREGVAEYRESENGKRVKNLRIYYGVRVLYPKCTVIGVAHAISFAMHEGLRFLRWDTSKRLLEGSLVCLSKDKFQTMIFATVTKRDPEMLKDGIIFVCFENYDEAVKTIRPYEEYVMLETSAFFEAYRHVLLALQDMHEENFPFKRYIVDVCDKVNPPSYLTEFTQYDLRPLLLEIPKVRVSEGGEDTSEMTFSPLVDYVKKIPLLEAKAWPPAYDMKLDDSQLEALRSALTKEVAIIQGPPGTGKTFVGLRIVQALLHNVDIWRKGTQAPILIVCFTNHALDQFLEGVLYFTGSIVRVGGRSKSEILTDYLLSELRQNYKNRHAFPRALMFNKREILYRLGRIEKKINTLDLEINRACSDVITECDLKLHIMKEHLISLKTGNEEMPEFRDLHNDERLILDWLGVRFRGKYQQAWFNQETRGEDFSKEQSNHPLQTSRENTDLEADMNIEASWEFGADDISDFVDKIKEPDDLDEIYQSDESLDNNPEYQVSPDQYWEMNGGTKARCNYVKRMLNGRAVAMISDEDSKKIRNIWALPLVRRWQLYRLWTSRYIMGHYESINDLQSQYQRELAAMAELRHACDLHILQGAKVIGMTTTGAAKNKNLLKDLGPPILIVEEAAEVMEAHIVTCLTESTKHLIMIGDHQQLRPIPSVYMLAKSYNLDVSLFERLVKNGLPKAQLSIQHRMRPCISKLLVPHIYKKLSDHRDTKKYLEIKGIAKSMFFVTHRFHEGVERDSTSKVNTHEAEYIVKLSKYVLQQGYKTSQITILATYSGQLLLIKKLMKSDTFLEGIHATSVDNYQGEENDIILISFVRSNESMGIGFLKTENRVCVALSRARMGLYCVGDFRFLADNSQLWKNIVQELEDQNAIGPDLKLYCQNHNTTTCEVRRALDFESAPEGGCTRRCDVRLDCGHPCPRRCHAYDKNHKDFQCKEPCLKITCKEKHVCTKLCFQCHTVGCGDCEFRVLKELDCGHEAKVPCCIPAKLRYCEAPCLKILPCTHVCGNKCGEPCNTKCAVPLIKLSSCGHSVKIQCFKSENPLEVLKSCREACTVELSCGHRCRGSCSECQQNRLHMKCDKPCGNTLVCGHGCREPCSKNCPPCRQPCENVCFHSKCYKLCGVVCVSCRSPCIWNCPHLRCTMLCGELCNRPMCKEPCPKLLPCKHPCVGLCGELCPELCRICHKKKLTKSFFGTEDEEHARFLKLEGCIHIFEVNGFIHWMEEEVKSAVIKIPRCPICKTVIRDCNNCVGNIIKTCLKNVSLVKEKLIGNIANNNHHKRDLKMMAGNLVDTVHNNFKPIVQTILTRLGMETADVNRLNGMENYLRMVQQMDMSLQEMNRAMMIDKRSKFVFATLVVIVDNVKLESLMNNLMASILQFMLANSISPTHQQVKDLDSEVHRFQLLAKLLCAAQDADEKQAFVGMDYQKLTACCTTLLAPKPLEPVVFKKVNETIRALNMTRGMAQLRISEEEKRVIVQAVGLRQGHWFKCPNGHVYCIGECGGATQVGKCGDCGVLIGGNDHQLVSGNSLADEMDGAAYPAYSEAANMANFEQPDDDWFDRES